MKKVVFLGIIGLVLLSVLVSAFNISLTPNKIQLQTQPEKQVCTNISINSEQASIVSIKDFWGRSSSDQINSYGMSRDAVAVKAMIPSREVVGAREIKTIEVCFTPGGEGTFYGVIVFESFNKQAKNGFFVELKASFQTSTGEINLMGMEHRDIKPVSTEQTIIAFSILTTIFLICILIYLLRVGSKKTKTKKGKKSKVIEEK